MLTRSKTLLFAPILASLGAQALSGQMNPYYLDVIVGIGINIILAVSLNLINGYTGQFSLGHAGFMAVGAYTSAMITTTCASSVIPKLGGGVLGAELFFVGALIAGG